MDYPHIKFLPMSLEENVDIIKWTFFDEDEHLPIKEYTLKYFPELKNIDITSPKEETYDAIERIVANEYHKNELRLKEEAERYNLIWKNFNELYFQVLSKYLNQKWPEDKAEIKAFVGLIPVFPRYLDTFSFALSTELDEEKIIETCAHETCHFLWFLKCKMLFPEIPRKEYDSPYPMWQYSEMVVDPIINSKDINKVLKIKERAYPYFYNMTFNNDNVMGELQKIFLKEDSIENRIRCGYDYILKVLKK